MVSPKQLRAWQRGLRSTWPIVGTWRRHRTMAALESRRDDAEVIPLLVEALRLPDAALSRRASKALSELTSQEAKDAVGQLWAQSRDDRLGEIIATGGYTAARPIEVRLLTALKTGKVLALNQAELVPTVARLLEDPDRIVRQGAERSLQRLEAGPAQDALCNEAIKHPRGPVAQLCMRTRKRPRDHERSCLFLFVTRQLDEYFREDFEFQNLRLEYERADATVRAHVLDVVRSGDRRCARFFESRGKPLAECSAVEIRLALDSWQRHQEWPRLFQACLELPLKHGVPILMKLRHSGWEPEARAGKAIHRQIMEVLGEERPLPAPEERDQRGGVLATWLSRGASSELSKLTEPALMTRLKAASPPEAVMLVGALGAKGELSAAASQAIRDSPHWLVRLAGNTVGVDRAAPDPDHDDSSDPNYWVAELGSVSGLLEVWPGRATPNDLQTLADAPREAWLGRLGNTRELLRTIMSYRITTGVFEPMVVPVQEFAAEFVPASQGRSTMDKTDGTDEGRRS